MSGVKRSLLLFLKGMSMGAADVVPGVSGGTIALIAGIYEELIHSLKSIDIKAIRLLAGLRIADFWRAVNGSFLLILFSGILVSIFSLARFLKWALMHHPVAVWSFFLGLIIASALLVVRRVKGWSIARLAALLTGTAAMVLITRFSPVETTEAYWFIFLSGAIAVCAMILPGISGAFILLILGKYQFILGAVSSLNVPVLLVFGAGVVTGLLSFSKLLSYLLKRFHEVTLALLSGLIIGSLPRIWPWREVVSSRLNSHGELVPLVERGVAPWRYADLTGNDPVILAALLLVAAGIVLVVLLERLGKIER